MKRNPPIRCHCPGPCSGHGDAHAYAVHADVAPKSVYRWIELGKVVKGRDDRIDFATADAVRGGGTANDPDAPISYALGQARHEAAKAELAELKVAQLKGELISAAEVERLWYAILRTWRNRFQALPNAISADLAALARKPEDGTLAEHEVRVRLEAEIHTALEEIAAKIDAMAEAEEAREATS